MATENYTMNDRDKAIVQDIMRNFQEKQTMRNTTAGQWEEIAELVLPNFRNTFFVGNYNFPGQKKTQRQIDSTGALALGRFAAIMDSLLTPRNMFWHALGAEVDDVMKRPEARVWYEQATKVLFKLRYAPEANFASQNLANWTSLGAFGTAAMFIDELDATQTNGVTGLRYKAVPLGEIYIGENHQGIVDNCIRAFRMTARQCKQKFPNTFPAALQSALDKGSETPYNFLHVVAPRVDWDPYDIGPKGKPFASFYVSIEGQCILSEGGYRTFPYAITRYVQAPGEVYGRSPAMDVLPSLKTLNAQKATLLKQAHRAADPVYLLYDDGLYDFNSRPGAMNRGGMNQDGKRLVDILPTGNFQVTKEVMDEEKELINDVFLVRLFQILEETPQMTATEVIERVNEKGILIAPTVGRQQSEYLGPMIHRELNLAYHLGKLPPMPPVLQRLRGSYEVTYTTPIARAARAQEASGFMRTIESVKELVNITGDASLLDPFNFDVAVPAIAEIEAVPASWMSTPDQIANKRKNRAQAQAKQQAIQAMPAQAAMLKAQAVVRKNEPGVAPGEQGVGGPMQQPQGAPQGPMNMAGR